MKDDSLIPTEVNVSEYLSNRLVDQMNWYDKKSIETQKKYKELRRIEIISAAVIPFLSGFVSLKIYSIPIIQIMVGFIGVGLAVVAGLLALNNYQELWIKYRTTSELLKHQLFLFQTKTSPYTGNEQERFNNLVFNTESVLSNENFEWSRLVFPKEQDKNTLQ